MSHDLSISQYRSSDAAEVRALEPEFFEWYSGKIERGTILVARLGRRAVGFLFVVWHRGPAYFDSALEPVAEIDEVVVHRGFRNRGIGTALVHRALEEATRHGCRAVYLETDDFNAPARRVYENCGFLYHNLVIRYKRMLP